MNKENGIIECLDYQIPVNQV